MGLEDHDEEESSTNTCNLFSYILKGYRIKKSELTPRTLPHPK